MNKKRNNKIIPLGSRVLVEPEEAGAERHKRTDTGIYIPENSGDREKPERGVVIAVGAGEYDDGKIVPMKVKVGDKVVFSKYGYDEISMGERKYFILKEENILAIVK